MKKSVLFVFLSSIVFCASAQKEENFQFGGFANVNHCRIINNSDGFGPTVNPISGVEKTKPTMGYQFSFLTQYAFSTVSKLQFGIGMAQTESSTGTFLVDNTGAGVASFENRVVHQDIMLPVLYKRHFAEKSPFYVIVGLTPLFKANRIFNSIITLSDGSKRETSARNNGVGTRNINLNPSLGIGYEMKILKDNYFFIQPNFDINTFSSEDFGAAKRFYTIGLTVGVLSK